MGQKKLFLLIVVLSTLILSVSASQDRWLVAIDSTSLSGMSRKVIAELLVYHITDEVLIAGCNDLTSLALNNVPFTILDNNAWAGKYYLVSSKSGKSLELDRSFGAVVYSTNEIAMLRTEEGLSLDQVLQIGYSVTEMFPFPLDYRVEKVNQNLPVSRNESNVRPEIQTLLNTINADSLATFIQTLEDFGTRFCLAPNRDQVTSWIKQEFLRFGFTDVVLDSFNYNNTWQKNVIATLPGAVNPEQVVVIGGHHDSIISQQYGNPMITAPGADDNASGTAAALEIARAMKAIDFQPETTIQFVTFAAEELGLHGSHHFASRALVEGMNIKLMINNDMIGYTTQSPNNWTIHLIEYTGYENHANFTRQIMQQYTSITPVTYTYNASYSDSYAFWIRGFAPIFFIETVFNPYYHTPNDLTIHMDMDYAAETVRATAAVAALINEIPDMPESINVQDAGNGTDLIVSWSPVLSSDIDHYEVYLGLSSGSYQQMFATQDTHYVFSNLNHGTTYFIGVASYGASGYSSSIIEGSGTPLINPLTPNSFRDEPNLSYIELLWSANNEADLAGYYLYRSDTSDVQGEIVPPGLIIETFFIDADVTVGEYYYYSLTAVDLSGNESAVTDQISYCFFRSRDSCCC